MTTISVFEFYYVYFKALVPRPREATHKGKQIVNLIPNYAGMFLLTFSDKSQRIVSEDDVVEVEG